MYYKPCALGLNNLILYHVYAKRSEILIHNIGKPPRSVMRHTQKHEQNGGCFDITPSAMAA